MTLYQITSYLKQIALSSPYIRTAEEGSVYTIMNGNPHSRYGVFVISQTQHRQDDIFDYYGFNMFVIDRLVDDLESNRLQIQSLAKEVLANTILTLITKFYGITHNELQFHPFTEKFVDLTAGQYVQVTFQVPRNLICPDDYNLDFNPEYVLEPLVVEITENGIFEYEPEDIDGYNKVTVTVNVDIPDSYESGFTSGVTYQKSLLVPTAFTENGVYSTENGYSEVTVNVDTDAYYNSGFTSGATYQKGLIIPLTVDENGVYEREDGYSPVTVNIDTDAYYNSGYTGGYESGTTDGFESGVTYQKSLLSAITIDHNGEYINENGYSAITVNVPQESGASINNQTKSVEYTQNGDYSVNYDNGYTGLEAVNININVPQSAYTSGYTQEDLDNAYQSGITYQKGLLSAATFTSNGTYTRVNGYSAVTVDVQSDISHHLLIVNFANNQDLSELVHNVVVTVTNSSGSTNYTYDGINLRINLLPGVSYTISYSSLAGRTTPSSDSLTTIWGGRTTIYPVWQKNITPTLSVTPTGYTFDYAGEITSLTVQSNTGWTVTSKPNWLTLTKSSGSSGTTTITASVGSTSSFRSGTTVFKTSDNSITRNVVIKQRASGVSDNYLTIEATSAGNIVMKNAQGVYYKKNTGSWVASNSAQTISVASGDKVKFKRDRTEVEYSDYFTFSGTKITCITYGNAMSLQYADNFDGQTGRTNSLRQLYAGCTGLTSAENLILPASIVSVDGYEGMFMGCTSLTKAPVLPATTLAEMSYFGMFRRCTSLTTAPALPATNLGRYCYISMFADCTSLINAPALQVTALTEGCYSGMFNGCTSLQTAPDLPATALVSECYQSMFEGCTKLKYVKCLAKTGINPGSSSSTGPAYTTTDWLEGVASSGTFVKKSGVTWPTGVSGIPQGWTVIEE